MIVPASAQTFVNGSFETGNFNGYTTAGGPVVVGAPPTPVNGNDQALINSTGVAAPAGNYNIAASVPAATLNIFLNTTLPGNAEGAAINGQAIRQDFTTPGLGSARLTFSYAYNSREAPGNGFDETGYVINGNFHILADSNTPGQTVMNNGFFVFGLPYATTSLLVGPGANALGFVAYNTGNTTSPSGLFIDNIILIPLFGTVPGLTPNQNNVATYIDSLNTGVNTGNLGLVIAQLTADPSVAQLGSHLDELSPQSLQVFSDIAFDNATFTTQDVTNHLANLRDGLTGFDDGQLTVNDPSMSQGASQISNRLAHHHPGDPKDMGDPKNMGDSKEMGAAQNLTAYTPEPDRWSTFIAGQVTLADLDHDMDMAHQDYTSSSVMVGADYRIDNHFTVGSFLSFSHTDADLDHIGSSATVDTYSPGLYGSYVNGGWYANALVAYGFNSYTSNRNIDFTTISGTNTGATQGSQYQGSLGGGYEFQTGHFKYGPFAQLQYVNLNINSFNEEGPTALDIGQQNADSLRSQVGFEARYAQRVGPIYLVPHASVAWQHEFLDNSRDITSQFDGTGSGTFDVQTTGPDRESAFIDVGINADLNRDVTLFTDYETEVGGNYSDQSVQGGVRIGF
jgi:uncharacterized protein with beta-barrel porin domain